MQSPRRSQTTRVQPIRLARRLAIWQAEWHRILVDFPWKTAARQLIYLSSAFLATLAIFGYWLRQSAIEHGVSAVGEFDRDLALIFVAMLAIGLCWLIVVTYWNLRPLGRILRFTRRRGSTIYREDEFFSDEPGEWSDLEIKVDALARSVKLRESDLLREREELATILGSVSEAIVAMGRETEPFFFNSRFAILFGAASIDGDAPPLRERFRDPELLSGFQRVLREGQTRTFRVRLRTELHGADRDFSVAVSPLLSREEGETNTPYGAVAIFHDISELKQTEQMRVDFVANASHELKTPLTSIKGYVDTLREDVKTGRLEDAPGFLSTVSRNVDRLILLVQDLLDLSTLESGTEVKKALLSTAEVSEVALRLVEGKSQRRRTVHLECRTDRLLGEARRIEQVLVNLIDNAMKYAPDGTEIRVIWEAGTGTNTGETVLRVQDDGPGIADEHMPRLFERFYRVDAGRAREVGGTGLGLAIVKHIVLAHGGSIAVRSKLGEGSEFICRFPLR